MKAQGRQRKTGSDRLPREPDGAVGAGFKKDLVRALVVTKAPKAIGRAIEGNRGMIVDAVDARAKEHVAGAQPES